MNRETFDIQMKNEGWNNIGKPDIRNELSSDPNIDWEKRSLQNQYEKFGCLVYITDQEIHQLVDFNTYLKDINKHYYFKDDWKKAFKGSEFLIPVIEEMLHKRDRIEAQNLLGVLLHAKENPQRLDDKIEELQKFLES